MLPDKPKAGELQKEVHPLWDEFSGWVQEQNSGALKRVFEAPTGVGEAIEREQFIGKLGALKDVLEWFTSRKQAVIKELEERQRM